MRWAITVRLVGLPLLLAVASCSPLASVEKEDAEASPYDLVRKAILKKQIVVANYDGHRRWLCPHVIGTSKTGRKQALFYQFDGGSDQPLGPDGSPNNWRCIPIGRMTNIEIRSGAWHTAGNHSRPQTCVNHIDVEVDY